MDKALKTIKDTLQAYEEGLKEMREEFDRLDANHPYAQCRVAQDIAVVTAKIDALKHLYKILGGE